VAALGEHLGDVPAEPSGRAGNCDLHASSVVVAVLLP